MTDRHSASLELPNHRRVGGVVVANQVETTWRFGEKHLQQSCGGISDYALSDRTWRTLQSSLSGRATTDTQVPRAVESVDEPGSISDGGANAQSFDLRSHEGLEVVEDDGLPNLVELSKRPSLEQRGVSAKPHTHPCDRRVGAAQRTCDLTIGRAGDQQCGDRCQELGPLQPIGRREATLRESPAACPAPKPLDPAQRVALPSVGSIPLGDVGAAGIGVGGTPFVGAKRRPKSVGSSAIDRLARAEHRSVPTASPVPASDPETPRNLIL